MVAPAQSNELLGTLLAAMTGDVGGWLRAWARVSPLLTLVPIFGGSALPAATRAGLGAALALAIAPALRPVGSQAFPLPLELAAEAARGLPVALGAALLIHAALMAGGAMDDLRGGRESSSLPVFDSEHTPLGALLAMLVTILLLESGGASRLVATLAQPVLAPTSLAVIVSQIAAVVSTAVAVAAPVAAVSLLSSVVEALLARAASPAHVSALLAPLRTVVVLAIAALALDRMVALLALSSPR
jgi:flagellar biosynthetic protein FliR